VNIKLFKTLFLILFLLPWILLSSCTSKIDPEKEKEDLLKTDIEFSKTSVEKGAAEAFYLYLADDAVQLPAGLPPIVGREKIRESMSGSSKAILKWEPVRAEVAKSGDLGYTWGSYELDWQGENGKTEKLYGKYLNIWKKQPDGTWKVVVDIGNQAPPQKKDRN
jgi:ketosteroid isomerase-like protein